MYPVMPSRYVTTQHQSGLD